VTKPDNGVAPAMGRAAQAATHGSVGVVELTHADVRDKLTDYLDDALPVSDRRAIDRHLQGCRPCAAFYATLRATVKVADSLPRPSAPRTARARILDRIREEAAQTVEPNGSEGDDRAPESEL
jgi:anti-sigma factor RsiW